MNQGDRRTVATDALETLGTILRPDQRRDAIHLAVEPVIAAERIPVGADIIVMFPGTTGTGNGKAYCQVLGTRLGRGEGTGIADPFIKKDFIEVGERFWYVMYPRQVHSLRHVWTHPAFPNEP